MYILQCDDGTYYTGSTKYLDLRLKQHHSGDGSNYTARRLPLELLYVEEFTRIDDAFNREKQIQGWSRAKKQALMGGRIEDLPEMAYCYSRKRIEELKNRR